MKTVDLLIIHGIVITMQGQGTGIVNDGAVAVQGSTIRAVGETAELRKEYDGHRVIDATDKVVMPGLIDCHSHSSLGIARGTAQDIDNWLYKGMFPIQANLDDDATQIGSLIEIAESVLNGTTTIGDYGDRSELVLQNHRKVGNRCVMTELIHEMPADIYRYDPMETFPFDPGVGEAKFAATRRMVQTWHGSGRITCMVGPQAANMCSLELLRELYEYARKEGLDIHIHVSQSHRENNQCEKRYGLRAIPFLEKNGLLGPQVLAAHISHAQPEEVRTMARHGCRMVLCSNCMALINGTVPPAAEYMEMGGVVGLGTDQAPGNNRNNMFLEMKVGDLLNKCKAASGTVFPAWQMLRLGTIESARALGMADQIGSLEVGKKADLIILDLLHPHMTPIILSPVRNIVPNLIYSADGREVETVIVDGQVIVDGGELTNLNLKDAIHHANEAGKRFSNRMESFEGLNDVPLAQWTKAGLY